MRTRPFQRRALRRARRRSRTPTAGHRTLSRSGRLVADVEFYWGDERTVPPEDPESNYRMARETLLDPLPVHPEQVHRIRGELPATDSRDALRAGAARELRPAAGELPRFDSDPAGHGAGWAHRLALSRTRRRCRCATALVVANACRKLEPTRITLTAPVLNAAAAVVFLVAGADKADALAAVLRRSSRTRRHIPRRLIAPAMARCTGWWTARRRPKLRRPVVTEGRDETAAVA